VGRFRVPVLSLLNSYRTDGGLFTDTGEDEQGENERQSENEYQMKTVS